MDKFITRSSCPACDSKNAREIYSPARRIVDHYLLDFYGGTIDLAMLEGWKYSIVECAHCSLMYQPQILGDDLMKMLYEQWIDPSLSRESTVNKPLYYFQNLVQEINNVLLYFNRLPSSVQMLDFGMGWGEWCVAAKALGADPYGIDLSEQRKRHARANGIKVFDTLTPDHKFDLINTEQVFEHLPQPKPTLLMLKQHLKDDGLIKISVPDSYDMKRLLKNPDWNAPKGTSTSLNALAPLEHINSFTFKSLMTMAESAGLRWVSSLSFENYPLHWIENIKNALRPPYIRYIKKNKGTYLYLKRA